MPSSHSNTPSVSSYRSSNTGRSKNTSSNRSHRSTNSKHADGDDKTGKIFDLDNEFGGEVGGFGATGYLFDMLQKAVGFLRNKFFYLHLLFYHFFSNRKRRNRKHIMSKKKESKENLISCLNNSPKQRRT